MAQFGSSTYGSRFNTVGGLRGNGPQGPNQFNSLGSLLAANQNTFQAPSFDTPTVNPSTAVKLGQVQAPPSSFDPSQGAALPNVPGGPSMNDLSTDPILMQIRAAGQRQVQDARTAAMANAENDIIGYGGLTGTDNLKALYAADQSNPIYGALADSNTAQAAAANPDSTLHQLASKDQANTASIDNQRNLQNLFYSSTRANDLGNEATNYRQAQNQAAGSLASLLGGENQNVLNAEQGAENDYLNNLSGAWQRWLALNQNAGSGGGGAPGTTSPPTTQAASPGVSSIQGKPTSGGFFISPFGPGGANYGGMPLPGLGGVAPQPPRGALQRYGI